MMSRVEDYDQARGDKIAATMDTIDEEEEDHDHLKGDAGDADSSVEQLKDDTEIHSSEAPSKARIMSDDYSSSTVASTNRMSDDDDKQERSPFPDDYEPRLVLDFGGRRRSSNLDELVRAVVAVNKEYGVSEQSSSHELRRGPRRRRSSSSTCDELQLRLHHFHLARRMRHCIYYDTPFGVYGLFHHLKGLRLDLEWADDAAYRCENGLPYFAWQDLDRLDRRASRHYHSPTPYITLIIVLISTVTLVVSFYLSDWQFASSLRDSPAFGPPSWVLVKMGGLEATRIVQLDEWWRLITAMFIHGGILHYLINMVLLSMLGSLVERVHGSWQTLVVFLVSGMGGNLLSALFMPHILSVGTSGGIFGLAGLCLADVAVHWDLFCLKQENDAGSSLIDSKAVQERLEVEAMYAATSSSSAANDDNAEADSVGGGPPFHAEKHLQDDVEAAVPAPEEGSEGDSLTQQEKETSDSRREVANDSSAAREPTENGESLPQQLDEKVVVPEAESTQEGDGTIRQQEKTGTVNEADVLPNSNSFPIGWAGFWLLFELSLVILLGLTPLLDNFAHLGGLFYGFCMGLYLLPHDSRGFFDAATSRFRRCACLSTRATAVILATALFTSTTLLLWETDNPTTICKPCRHLSCLPFPFWLPAEQQWWRCDGCDSVAEAQYYFSSTSNTTRALPAEVELTCPYGEIVTKKLEDVSPDEDSLRAALPSLCRELCSI